MLSLKRGQGPFSAIGWNKGYVLLVTWAFSRQKLKAVPKMDFRLLETVLEFCAWVGMFSASRAMFLQWNLEFVTLLLQTSNWWAILVWKIYILLSMSYDLASARSGFCSPHQLRSRHSLGRKQLWFRKCWHPPSSCWVFGLLTGELSLQGHQGTSCLPPASSGLSPWRPPVQGKRTQGRTPVRTPTSGAVLCHHQGWPWWPASSVACFSFWIWSSCPFTASVKSWHPSHKLFTSARAGALLLWLPEQPPFFCPTLQLFFQGLCVDVSVSSFLMQEAELHPPLFPSFSSPTPQASYQSEEWTHLTHPLT